MKGSHNKKSADPPFYRRSLPDGKHTWSCSKSVGEKLANFMPYRKKPGAPVKAAFALMQIINVFRQAREDDDKINCSLSGHYERGRKLELRRIEASFIPLEKLTPEERQLVNVPLREDIKELMKPLSPRMAADECFKEIILPMAAVLSANPPSSKKEAEALKKKVTDWVGTIIDDCGVAAKHFKQTQEQERAAKLIGDALKLCRKLDRPPAKAEIRLIPSWDKMKLSTATWTRLLKLTGLDDLDQSRGF